MDIVIIKTSASAFKEQALKMQNALTLQGINNNCSLIYKEDKLWLRTFTSSHFLAHMPAVSNIKNMVDITFSLTKAIKVLEDKGDVTITITDSFLIVRTDNSEVQFQILKTPVPTFTEKLLPFENGHLSSWKAALSKALRVMSLNKILAKDAPILCFESSLQLRYPMVWFKFKIDTIMETTISLKTAKLMNEFLKDCGMFEIKVAERSYCWKAESLLLYLAKEFIELDSFSEQMKGLVPLVSVNNSSLALFIKDLATLDKASSVTLNFNKGGIIVSSETLNSRISYTLGTTDSLSLSEVRLPAELANVIFSSLGDTFEVLRGERRLCLKSMYLTVLLAL